MMFFGGNGRARVFFKQHGWTDGGKIESKYTSRAAELYKQLLAKEVAKSAISPALPSPSKDASVTESINNTPKETQEPPKNAPTTSASAVKSHLTGRKPVSLGAKKGGVKSSGLGVKKLATKVTICVSFFGLWKS